MTTITTFLGKVLKNKIKKIINPNIISDLRYGIYKVFISSKKDVSILTDMANNKVIYPMKKAAFEWKVLVRSNHEHYFQRRLIENNINYFVIQSSHTE